MDSASPEARRALDLEQESASRRDRYGNHIYGESFLMARRLVEAGVRLVTVNWMHFLPQGGTINPWDNHGGSTFFPGLSGVEILQQPWFRGHFGWEYKKKHKDLDAAYNQLQLYREDLENPPLLIVCDLDRFEIHTNFTNTAKRVYHFSLLNLGDPGSLDLLNKLFTNPEALRPTQTTDEITKELADEFAALADSMQARLGIGNHAAGLFAEQQAHRIARFLMKLMFCMFAEDIGLLQGKLFERILGSSRREPVQLSFHEQVDGQRSLPELFAAARPRPPFRITRISSSPYLWCDRPLPSILFPPWTAK